MDVTVLFLHTNDVGRVIRFVLIYLVLVEGKEAKLEEVLDDDGDLEAKQKVNEAAKTMSQLSNQTSDRLWLTVILLLGSNMIVFLLYVHLNL